MKLGFYIGVLCLAAVLSWLNPGWWEVVAGLVRTPPPLDADAFHERVLERARGVDEGIEPAEDLRRWLRTTAVAADFKNVHTLAGKLQREHPVYAEIEAVRLLGRDLEEIEDEANRWVAGRDGRATHLVSTVHHEPENPAELSCIVIAARRLPRFEPALLSQPLAEFCAACPLCGHEHPALVHRDVRGVILHCPECQRPYDLLCQDLSGAYRHVNQFLEGYAPPSHFADDVEPLARMRAIWRTVVEHCRYAEDVIGLRGERDQWQTPSETHAFAAGDCEDTSLLLADWLIAEGFDARVALGHLLEDDGGEGGGHAWVAVRLDGETYLLETTDTAAPGEGELPTVARAGHRYDARMLFDRERIYFRARAGWTPEYWSPREWTGVAYLPDPSEARVTRNGSTGSREAAMVVDATPWLGRKPSTGTAGR